MKKLSMLVLLGLFAPAMLVADASPYYIGASIIDADTKFMGETDGDTGFEARVGYVLSEYVSFEASYLELGSMELPSFPDAGGSIDSEGYALSVLATLPLDRFSLFGKAGNLWWESDGYLGSIAGPVSYSKDGTELLLGAGVSFDVSEKIALKMEYNDSGDFDWTSLGLNVRF